ncbi:MAG: hypothetical protein D3919_14150, partial [Candidatus Electrothrix sp. AW5]|nr:hypothetical protein [Candidatus Electrothrix gigas]
ILNQIATPRHERIITEAVEKYTGMPVVGIIPRMKTDIFPLRLSRLSAFFFRATMASPPLDSSSTATMAPGKSNSDPLRR